MSLFEEHKAERRARILVAARELIAARATTASRCATSPARAGFRCRRSTISSGASRRSCSASSKRPSRRRREHRAVPAGNFVDRALATCEAGNADLLAAPRYSRELILLFLTSAETAPLRRAIAERYAELMADVLRDGQTAGEIHRGSIRTVSRRMFAHYTHAMIEWARGELDDGEFAPRPARHGA